MLFFVNFDTTAPEPEAFSLSNLPTNSIHLVVLIFDIGLIVYSLLQIHTLTVKIVVFAYNAAFYKDTLASDGIRRIELDHVGWYAALQRLNSLIDRQVAHLHDIVWDIGILELLHRIGFLLPFVVFLTELVNHVKGESRDYNNRTYVGKIHLWLLGCDVQNCSLIHCRHIHELVVIWGHRIARHIQRYDDEQVKDSDCEQKSWSHTQKH